MEVATLPIHERFLSFQGEGVHMGRSAFFIRTFGCPVHCSWCDSAGTWHKDWVPKEINRVTLETLFAESLAARASFVVLTGGEPTVHKNLEVFSGMLIAFGLRVHVETCGAFPISEGAFDWITLSPKWSQLPLASNLWMADELKIIVEDEDSIDKWLACLQTIAPDMLAMRPSLQIWLHPEWSQRNNQKVLDSITNKVANCGGPFRAGYQLHKLYLADATDPRAVSSAPLGGDPAQGPST